MGQIVAYLRSAPYCFPITMVPSSTYIITSFLLAFKNGQCLPTKPTAAFETSEVNVLISSSKTASFKHQSLKGLYRLAIIKFKLSGVDRAGPLVCLLIAESNPLTTIYWVFRKFATV